MATDISMYLRMVEQKQRDKDFKRKREEIDDTAQIPLEFAFMMKRESESPKAFENPSRYLPESIYGLKNAESNTKKIIPKTETVSYSPPKKAMISETNTSSGLPFSSISHVSAPELSFLLKNSVVNPEQSTCLASNAYDRNATVPNTNTNARPLSNSSHGSLSFPRQGLQNSNWVEDFHATFDKDARWKTRLRATNEIKLLSLSQQRSCMLDRKNKGGKSLVLRCASAVKCESGCPFYAKLRRSNKDGLWYICTGLDTDHNCTLDAFPPNFAFVESMMAARTVEEEDDHSKEQELNYKLNRHLNLMFMAPKNDTAI